MLKIYHAPPTRSVRVVWLAEEMGLAYESISERLGRPTPALLAVSPLGALPAMEDGDVKMIESIAIMHYLLARHGPTPLAVAPEEADFPAYLQFLEFGEAGLAAIGNAFVATRFRAPAEQKENWTVDYVVKAMNKRLSIVETHLQTRQYAAAERFTAADISVAWSIGIAKFLGIVTDLAPTLEDYHARMTGRPAYAKAVAVAAKA